MARTRDEHAHQAVLASMRRALSAQGFAAVTIEGLAAEAGISKQTIYRWWPSKAAILGEALLEGELPGTDVDVPFSDDLARDLHAWFGATSAALGTPEGAAVARALIAVTATDAALGRRLNARLAAPIRSWVVRRLQAAMAAGQVRPTVAADLVADQMVAITSYAALLDRPLDDRHTAEAVAMILHGIARERRS